MIGKFPATRAKRAFSVRSQLVNLSKASRRIERLKFKAMINLRKIERLARKTRAKMEYREQLNYVKQLRAERRKPHLRIRTRFSMSYMYLPRAIQYNRNSSYKIVSTSFGTQYTALAGENKSIQDFAPILKLNPPRNTTAIRQSVRGSNVASIRCEPVNWRYPTVYQPPSPWGLDGLGSYHLGTDITAAIGFDTELAKRALQKAYAKANSAIIQGNEYLFEFKQVLRLLKDPLRTVVGMAKTIERWTRRDAWIFCPERTFKRYVTAQGLVETHTSTGGVLISMRTKRTLPLSQVSDKMLQAAANRWLQYRYGVVPLVSDITTAISWYQGILGNTTWNNFVTARHTVSKFKSFKDYTTRTNYFASTFKTSKVTGEHYTAKLWFNVKYDPPLSYKLGVHPSQWLSVIWNAIPYSFVADWVVNLDDWLTASRNPPWIQYGPNTVTRKVYEKTVARCVSVKPAYTVVGAYKLEVLPGLPTAIHRNESMRRELDFPKPTELWVSDRWTSLKNILTGMALIYQPLFKRR